MRILKNDKISTNNILEKLKKVFKLIQVKMTESQQKQEKQINCYKKEIFKFIKGDKVWLRLEK